MTSLHRLLPLVFVAGVAPFACASAGDVGTCRVGADCASGVCRSDGTCVAPTTASSTGGGAPSSTTSSGGASTSSSSTVATGGGATSSGGGACSPNGDGTIDASEVPLGPGLHATYRTAANATVSSAGTAESDGSRDWDLSGAIAGDGDSLVSTLDPKAQWFGADFPDATYATQLTESSDLLGVFQVTATGLMLLGVASPASGATQTELTYTPPVTVLAFPLTDGATFMTSSTVSGKASGVVAGYLESYQSTVDAHGTMKTPFGSFPVLRVRTKLTRNAGVISTQTTFAWIAECFGTVAKMSSQLDDQAQEITKASEVERLSP